MKYFRILLLMVLCLGQPVLPAAETQGIQVVRGWVREAPPHAMSVAAYLRLRNQGLVSRRLVGVSSPQFQGAMMHVTVVEYGVARMRALDGLDIPAGGVASFAPGGRHIMLMGPAHALHGGDHVDLVLKFADGSDLHARLPVLRQVPAE